MGISLGGDDFERVEIYEQLAMTIADRREVA